MPMLSFKDCRILLYHNLKLGILYHCLKNDNCVFLLTTSLVDDK